MYTNYEDLGSKFLVLSLLNSFVSSTAPPSGIFLDKKDATKAKRKKKKSKKKKFNHPVFESKGEEPGDFKCWTCFEDSYDGKFDKYADFLTTGTSLKPGKLKKTLKCF